MFFFFSFFETQNDQLFSCFPCHIKDPKKSNFSHLRKMLLITKIRMNENIVNLLPNSLSEVKNLTITLLSNSFTGTRSMRMASCGCS